MPLVRIPGNCLSSVLPSQTDDTKDGGYNPPDPLIKGIYQLHKQDQVLVLENWITSQFLKPTEGCRSITSVSQCTSCREYLVPAVTYIDQDGVLNFHVEGYDSFSSVWFGRRGTDKPFKVRNGGILGTATQSEVAAIVRDTQNTFVRETLVLLQILYGAPSEDHSLMRHRPKITQCGIWRTRTNY